MVCTSSQELLNNFISSISVALQNTHCKSKHLDTPLVCRHTVKSFQSKLLADNLMLRGWPEVPFVFTVQFSLSSSGKLLLLNHWSVLLLQSIVWPRLFWKFSYLLKILIPTALGSPLPSHFSVQISALVEIPGVAVPWCSCAKTKSVLKLCFFHCVFAVPWILIGIGNMVASH